MNLDPKKDLCEVQHFPRYKIYKDGTITSQINNIIKGVLRNGYHHVNITSEQATNQTLGCTG
jgi:hypothetical protein